MLRSKRKMSPDHRRSCTFNFLMTGLSHINGLEFSNQVKDMWDLIFKHNKKEKKI